MAFKKQKELSKLDVAIADVLSDMRGFTSDADEYSTMVEQLVKLHALKEAETPKKLDKDTILIVAGNLVGIAMILSFEKTHVITTKAIQFMLKPRMF